MKQFLFAIALLIVTTFASAQEWNGIKISGSLASFVAQAKEKGLSLTSTQTNSAVLEGLVGARSVEVYVFTTPKTKQVYKVTIYLPKQSSWYSLKSDYRDYLELLTNKYGKPTSTYTFFSKPYEEGDGYEMTAVGAEKCSYSAFWMDGKVPHTNIGINISKYSQVSITYENIELLPLKKREAEQMETNAF